MFCTNDVSVAEKICDPKIKVHNLLLSQETDGIEDFKKSLADIFKGMPPSLYPPFGRSTVSSLTAAHHILN